MNTQCQSHRALMGAGLFITTTVLATVMLVTKGRNYNIGYLNISNQNEMILMVVIYLDKIDFIRDIVAYMVVLAVIVGVLFDGKVNCKLFKMTFETIQF